MGYSPWVARVGYDLATKLCVCVCIDIYRKLFFSALGYYKLIEYSSLCYAVGPFLSVLYMVVCIF